MHTKIVEKMRTTLTSIVQVRSSYERLAGRGTHSSSEFSGSDAAISCATSTPVQSGRREGGEAGIEFTRNPFTEIDENYAGETAEGDEEDYGV